MLYLIQNLYEANYSTVWISLGSIGFLLFCKGPLKRVLKNNRVPDGLAIPLAQGAPLVLVVAATTFGMGIGPIWSRWCGHRGASAPGSAHAGSTLSEFRYSAEPVSPNANY